MRRDRRSTRGAGGCGHSGASASCPHKTVLRWPFVTMAAEGGDEEGRGEGETTPEGMEGPRGCAEESCNLFTSERGGVGETGGGKREGGEVLARKAGCSDTATEAVLSEVVISGATSQTEEESTVEYRCRKQASSASSTVNAKAGGESSESSAASRTALMTESATCYMYRASSLTS